MLGRSDFSAEGGKPHLEKENRERKLGREEAKRF